MAKVKSGAVATGDAPTSTGFQPLQTVDLGPSPAPKEVVTPAEEGAAPPEQQHDGPLARQQSARDEIHARRRQQLEQEMGVSFAPAEPAAESEPEASETAQSAPEPAAPAEVAPAAATEQQPAPPPASVAVPPSAAGEPPKKRTLKVNGQTIELSDEELERAAQQGLAANQRFEEAAALKRQAEQTFSQIYGQRQPQPQQNTAAPAAVSPQQQPAHPATQAPLDAEEARALARQFYGSEQEVANALLTLASKLTATGRAEGPTPEQIAAVATQNAVATVRFENNLATVYGEYPEVFNDDDLTIVAANRLGKLRAAYQNAGIAKPDLELYREAARSVHDQYLKPKAQSPQPQSEPQKPAPAPVVNLSAERTERKRALPQQPAAAGARSPAEATEKRYPTGSEIVANMRKMRGLPAER